MGDSNEYQLLESILHEQRDSRTVIDRLAQTVHEIRVEQASVLERLKRTERDVDEAKANQTKIWNKLYEYGFQAAVITYIIFEQRPWEGVAK